MSYKNGSIIGVDNTPTASVASGIWDLNSVRDFREQGVWPGMATLDFNESTSNPITHIQSTAGDNSFASVDIGDPADKSDRIVIVVARIFGEAAAALMDIDHVDIAGTVGTLLAESKDSDGSNNVAHVFIAARLVTSGTTTTIDVNVTNGGTGAATRRVGIDVYWIKGLDTTVSQAALLHDTSITTTGTDPLTGTINAAEGGAIVAGAAVGGSTGSGEFEWTGAVEDSDQNSTAGAQSGASQGSLSSETGRTITANQSVAEEAQAMAAISLKGRA